MSQSEQSPARASSDDQQVMPEIAQDLRAACVEQVMRVSADESLALQVHAVRTRRQLLVVLGASVGDLAGVFFTGSPLLAAAGVGVLDQAWRDRCPARPGSLFAELEFLRALQPPLDAADILDELTSARACLES